MTSEEVHWLNDDDVPIPETVSPFLAAFGRTLMDHAELLSTETSLILTEGVDNSRLTPGGETFRVFTVMDEVYRTLLVTMFQHCKLSPQVYRLQRRIDMDFTDLMSILGDAGDRYCDAFDYPTSFNTVLMECELHQVVAVKREHPALAAICVCWGIQAALTRLESRNTMTDKSKQLAGLDEDLWIIGNLLLQLLVLFSLIGLVDEAVAMVIRVLQSKGVSMTRGGKPT